MHRCNCPMPECACPQGKDTWQVLHTAVRGLGWLLLVGGGVGLGVWLWP